MKPRQDFKVLEDGMTLSIGNETLEIIHLPGHTPGSIGVLHQEKKLLCTGDMLFSDFPMLDSISGQGSQSDFEKSMEKILKLISEEKVDLCLPGHGLPFESEKAFIGASRYLEFRRLKPHFPSYF
eukprot:08266.XXX_333357_332928_1 [CDS] Oithona nana genome sequencing.